MKLISIRPAKDFALGAFYLMSGIYSLGLGIFLENQLRPVDGTFVTIATPDSLFPYEITLFVIFGVVFLTAAFFQFRRSYKIASGFLA